MWCSRESEIQSLCIGIVSKHKIRTDTSLKCRYHQAKPETYGCSAFNVFTIDTQDLIDLLVTRP